MDNTLFLIILLSRSAFTGAHEISKSDLDNGADDASGGNDDSGGSVSHVTLGSSVGSVLLFVLLAWLIYYLCVRNKAPNGFTQFNNDNERNPRRKHWRWRNKRFWRRNRQQNFGPNNVEATQSTQVIIQPVVLAVPSQDQNPSMSTAPPAYDESMNNMPMPNQFANPPMPGQFMNPPMPRNFNNQPMPGNFNNSPMPGNFNNSPMPGNFNNPPMPGNFHNQPQQNPNAPPYYTKH